MAELNTLLVRGATRLIGETMIESWAGTGSSTEPVYFDANGQPQVCHLELPTGALQIADPVGNGNAITSLTVNGMTITPHMDTTFRISETPISVQYSGTGNAISALSANGHTITATKSEFLTRATETTLSINETGLGNAVTEIAVSGHTITAIKGTAFLTTNKLVISSLPDNQSSYTLTTEANHTYQKVTITSATSILLSGGAANPGYEHYILFINSGTSTCVISLESNVVAPATSIPVAAGSALEVSYFFNGTNLVFLFSKPLSIL